MRGLQGDQGGGGDVGARAKMASRSRHHHQNAGSGLVKSKSSGQQQNGHPSQQASEFPVDIPLDISFLDTPVHERSANGASHAGRRGRGGNGGGGGAGGHGPKGGSSLDEKNLFSIVGEIGRLQAIEQEVRARSRASQDLDQLRHELRKEKAENATLKQTLHAQTAELAKSVKAAEAGMKRVEELEGLVRDQQKQDDGFAVAMEELIQKQRQLEVREREVAERAKQAEIKEGQMRTQAGHQERSLKEIQSLVWAREQQMWEMEQMHRIAQENFQKQIAALQAEIRKHEEARAQTAQATPPVMGPVATPQHQQQAATPPPPQHVSQIDAWNANLPLLDQDTLKQLIRQFLPAGVDLSKPWTADDRAKLDTFLLPHSWAADYEPIYGRIEDFVSSNRSEMAIPVQTSGPMGVVVTPMPAAAAPGGFAGTGMAGGAPAPGAKKGRQQGQQQAKSGGKRKNGGQNRRNRKNGAQGNINNNTEAK